MIQIKGHALNSSLGGVPPTFIINNDQQVKTNKEGDEGHDMY